MASDDHIGLGEDAMLALQLRGLGGDVNVVGDMEQDVGVMAADDLAVDLAVAADVVALRDGPLVHEEAAGNMVETAAAETVHERGG